MTERFASDSLRIPELYGGSLVFRRGPDIERYRVWVDYAATARSDVTTSDSSRASRYRGDAACPCAATRCSCFASRSRRSAGGEQLAAPLPTCARLPRPAGRAEDCRHQSDFNDPTQPDRILHTGVWAPCSIRSIRIRDGASHPGRNRDANTADRRRDSAHRWRDRAGCRGRLRGRQPRIQFTFQAIGARIRVVPKRCCLRRCRNDERGRDVGCPRDEYQLRGEHCVPGEHFDSAHGHQPSANPSKLCVWRTTERHLPARICSA